MKIEAKDWEKENSNNSNNKRKTRSIKLYLRTNKQISRTWTTWCWTRPRRRSRPHRLRPRTSYSPWTTRITQHMRPPQQQPLPLPSPTWICWVTRPLENCPIICLMQLLLPRLNRTWLIWVRRLKKELLFLPMVSLVYLFFVVVGIIHIDVSWKNCDRDRLVYF